MCGTAGHPGQPMGCVGLVVSSATKSQHMCSAGGSQKAVLCETGRAVLPDVHWNSTETAVF